MLASAHLARRRDRRKQILDAGPWDVVLVDEAHHAGAGVQADGHPELAAGAAAGDARQQMWQALYLASATPMQMHPHEAWDLISLLGLKGKWGEAAFFFLNTSSYLGDPTQEPRLEDCSARCCADYFADPQADRDTDLERDIDDALGWAGSYAVTEPGRQRAQRGHAGASPERDI